MAVRRLNPPQCFLDVGSSHPGGALAAKGRAVRPLKGNVSWVYTGASQVVFYLLGALAV